MLSYNTCSRTIFLIKINDTLKCVHDFVGSTFEFPDHLTIFIQHIEQQEIVTHWIEIP